MCLYFINIPVLMHCLLKGSFGHIRSVVVIEEDGKGPWLSSVRRSVDSPLTEETNVTLLMSPYTSSTFFLLR